MGANPYLNDDDDADILSPSTSEVAQSESGRKKLTIRGVEGEALPEDLKNAISNYVDTENTDFGVVVGQGLPVEFRSVAWIFDYFCEYSRTKTDGPVMLAVAEVLDQMSDGRVSMLARLYEAERRIMWTQGVKRVLNVFITGDIFKGSNNPYLGEITMYFETYGDVINFIYDTAVNEYRALSAKVGKEPDEEFIQTGILSERSLLKAMTMGYPYAQRDTD